MTEDEREELIKKMRTVLINARLMGLDYESAASALLAVAEPVIRERCAHEANKRMVDADDYGAHLCEDIAAAIREGGGNGD